MALENGIDPAIMKAIMMKESGGNPSVSDNHNDNGTTDYGLMQINSGDGGWDVNRLKNDLSYNIQAAADTIKQKQATAKRLGLDPNNPFNIFWLYNGYSDQGKQYAQDAMKYYNQYS